MLHSLYSNFLDSKERNPSDPHERERERGPPFSYAKIHEGRDQVEDHLVDEFYENYHSFNIFIRWVLT